MIKRRYNILKHIDWISVLIYLFLMIFGWISILSASWNGEHHTLFDPNSRQMKQLIWIVVSLVFVLIIFLLDSKFFSVFAYLLYGLSILSLIAALFIGKEVSGAKAWIDFGFFRFQPSELAKIFTGLALAQLISKYHFDLQKLKHLLIAFLLILVPMGIILLQNDTGSALVFLAFILVFYREGMNQTFLFIVFLAIGLFVLSLIIPLYWIMGSLSFIAVLFFWLNEKSNKQTIIAILVPGILITGLFFLNEFVLHSLHINTIISIGIITPLLFFVPNMIRFKRNNVIVLSIIMASSILYLNTINFFYEEVLHQHQQDRIEHLLGMKEDPLGIGYNVNQSKIAIGSGGFSGKGFLNGTQTKFDFVPEQSTDFIFCTVGEEFGFLGSAFVVILFVVLFTRIIIMAERQRSKFSRVYGYAVASIFFAHFFINIGMTIGLMPVIGIPLPFFSYGGSSFMAFTILLFIFLRLDANRLEVFR
ncbi:MAG: rod shape-determining protein RodA [Bacteroidota bacterium]|nr:rod shape-determining protein RodA [Bacteroidota bacterium]